MLSWSILKVDSIQKKKETTNSALVGSALLGVTKKLYLLMTNDLFLTIFTRFQCVQGTVKKITSNTSTDIDIRYLLI